VLLRRPEIASSLTALGAEVVVGDLLDRPAIERAASGVRGVFHLAGQLFTPGVRAQTYMDLHVGATAALLQACAGADRLDFFVLCSTTGVHGATGAAPAREEDPGNPQNAYELTKAEGEHAATEIAKRAGLPLVIARPGLVYGPGDRHLLGWFRAIHGGYYRVIGPGANRFHPIYVSDLVRALLLCESAASVACRAYHLVGSHAVTVRELSDAIGFAVKRRVPRMHIPAPAAFVIGAAFEALPIARRALPLTRSRVRFLLQNRAYDGTRARQELGFVPGIDLAEGLSRTVAWYRENGLL